MIIVDTNRCPQDHQCPMVRVCQQKAISQKGFLAPVVDADKCKECMLCVQQCPYKVFRKR